MAKKKKRRKVRKGRVCLILLLLIACCTSVFGYLYYQDKQRQVEQQSIEVQIDALYQDDGHTRFIEGISYDDIQSIASTVQALKESDYKESLIVDIKHTQTLFAAYDCVKHMLINNILVDGVDQNDIDNMEKNLSKASVISKPFMKTIEADALNIMQQYHDIKEAKKKVSMLFQDDGKTIRTTITNNDYEAAKNYSTVVRNEKTLKTLQKQLDVALKQLNQQDEQNKEHATDTRSSYVVLDVPFINQTTAGAPQGCEAASLLMALRYKGIALNVGYYDFMDAMPVADDPNNGFVHSQYENEPKNVPHTIYPAPLAKYGSRYGNVVDISGSTPSQLRQELYAGNPIIVYIVSGFKEPVWVTTTYGKDILNMHVVTLIGYNDKIQKYLMNDPYYGNIWVDYETFDASYMTRNYAVAVR